MSPLTKLDRNSGPGYAVGVPFCTEGDSLLVVVSRACCPLPLPTKTVCTQPLIVTACPGIKCGGPGFLLALAAGQRKRDVAAQMGCGVATVWRACERYRRDGLEGLLADGREGRSGRLEQITPVQRGKSWNWPVWNQLPRACTSPIGPARTWLVKPWRTASLARSVLQRFAGCCTMLICSPIAPDIGRRPVWMPSSKSERSRSIVCQQVGLTTHVGRVQVIDESWSTQFVRCGGFQRHERLR